MTRLFLILAAAGALAFASGCSNDAAQENSGKSAAAELIPGTASDILTAVAEPGADAVLVNVWATWCPTCKAEHEELVRVRRETGLRIVGINYKDKPEAAKAFLATLGNPFTALGADRSGRAVIDWGVYGYPETFVVDKTGHIRYRHIGPIMPDDVNNKIYPLLEALNK